MPTVSLEFEAKVDEALAALDRIETQMDGLTESTSKQGEAAKKSTSTWTELNSAMEVGQKILGYAEKAYSAVVTPTLELASAQRELALAGQISVEEAGKLIQVADDLKISSDQLKTAFKAMTKEGLQPSIANIKEIAKQYQAADSPTEKLAIAQQGLGRSYQDLLPLLELAPGAIDEMAQSASDAGLVMSTEAVQAARDYELAVDDLTDSWQSFTVMIGQQVIPALTDTINSLTDANDRQTLAQRAVDLGAISLEEYQVTALNAATTNQALMLSNEELAQRIKDVVGFQGEATAGLTTYEIAAKNAALASGALAIEAGNVNAALEAQKADDASQVYKDAEKALKDFNIPMLERVELEERLAVISGKLSEDDLKRQEQIGYLTKQLELGNITQAEWIEGVQNLADGATNAGIKVKDTADQFIATGDAIEDDFIKGVIDAEKHLSNTLPAATVIAMTAQQEYAALMEEQMKEGGVFFRYTVGFQMLEAAAKRTGDAIRNIPPLSGGAFNSGAGSTGSGTSGDIAAEVTAAQQGKAF